MGFIALCLLLLLAACGQKGPAGGDAGETAEEEATEAVESADAEVSEEALDDDLSLPGDDEEEPDAAADPDDEDMEGGVDEPGEDGSFDPVEDVTAEEDETEEAAEAEADGCPGGEAPCGGVCCAAGRACAYGTCVPAAPCAGDDTCMNDSYCDDATGLCVPYGTGPRGPTNPDCTNVVRVARFSPALQCSFDEAPPGDPYPFHIHVLSTPMVADFNFDGDRASVRPSVVAVFDDGVDGSGEEPTGLLRIFDGRTCALQYNLDMRFVSHSSPPALGDLTADGVPEIVAFDSGGGLAAFTYHAATRRWSVLWRSHLADGTPYAATGGGWAGPSIHDVDDDGVPEVLRGGVIVDADGTVRASSLGYLVYSAGSFPVAADVDRDGEVELVAGNMIYRYDGAARDWRPEPTFAGAGLAHGHTAIGDFGFFPLMRHDPVGAPEVVVIAGGTARVQTIEGGVVFQATLPGGGGGPPTIGDFDRDGRAEFALAGRSSYTVFDLDCVPGGGTGTCGTSRTDGILWTRASQDYSSSVTGSSVFDFEGDDKAEAIYADECFVRVYEGNTGDVIYSQYRSSCTWYENPIVADCDGDFNSELIVPSNKNCDGGTGDGRPCEGLEPGGIDPQFPGLRCAVGADCASRLCVSGYCRCAADDDCCIGGCGGTGFVCAAPPAGTPGTGNTCRAAHPTGTAGIRIYMDAADNWIASRPVWNQHAYAVTNVNDDATIPRARDVRANWLTPGLNNFRQNILGGPGRLDAPDLTSKGAGWTGQCYQLTQSITLQAAVCNRGTQPVDAGVSAAFFDGDPARGGRPICSTATAGRLLPGQCEAVSCTWGSPPLAASDAAQVWVVADTGGTVSECLEGNNAGTIEEVYCDMGE